MREEDAWWLRATCKKLSPKQADALFFPGPGGKPHKSDNYCAQCPVLSQCLNEAILNKLPGFMAGTTETERAEMRAFVDSSLRTLEMPPEPDRTNRTIYLKVFTQPDNHDWMDEVVPDDNVLSLMDNLPSDDGLWDVVA